MCNDRRKQFFCKSVIFSIFDDISRWIQAIATIIQYFNRLAEIPSHLTRCVFVNLFYSENVRVVPLLYFCTVGFYQWKKIHHACWRATVKNCQALHNLCSLVINRAPWSRKNSTMLCLPSVATPARRGPSALMASRSSRVELSLKEMSSISRSFRTRTSWSLASGRALWTWQCTRAFCASLHVAVPAPYPYFISLRKRTHEIDLWNYKSKWIHFHALIQYILVAKSTLRPGNSEMKRILNYFTHHSKIRTQRYILDLPLHVRMLSGRGPQDFEQNGNTRFYEEAFTHVL